MWRSVWRLLVSKSCQSVAKYILVTLECFVTHPIRRLQRWKPKKCPSLVYHISFYLASIIYRRLMVVLAMNLK